MMAEIRADIMEELRGNSWTEVHAEARRMVEEEREATENTANLKHLPSTVAMDNDITRERELNTS